jgi:hypothetical protein
VSASKEQFVSLTERRKEERKEERGEERRRRRRGSEDTASLRERQWEREGEEALSLTAGKGSITNAWGYRFAFLSFSVSFSFSFFCLFILFFLIEAEEKKERKRKEKRNEKKSINHSRGQANPSWSPQVSVGLEQSRCGFGRSTRTILTNWTC